MRFQIFHATLEKQGASLFDFCQLTPSTGKQDPIPDHIEKLVSHHLAQFPFPKIDSATTTEDRLGILDAAMSEMANDPRYRTMSERDRLTTFENLTAEIAPTTMRTQSGSTKQVDDWFAKTKNGLVDGSEDGNTATAIRLAEGPILHPAAYNATHEILESLQSLKSDPPGGTAEIKASLDRSFLQYLNNKSLNGLSKEEQLDGLARTLDTLERFGAEVDPNSDAPDFYEGWKSKRLADAKKAIEESQPGTRMVSLTAIASPPIATTIQNKRIENREEEIEKLKSEIEKIEATPLQPEEKIQFVNNTIRLKRFPGKPLHIGSGTSDYFSVDPVLKGDDIHNTAQKSESKEDLLTRLRNKLDGMQRGLQGLKTKAGELSGEELPNDTPGNQAASTPLRKPLDFHIFHDQLDADKAGDFEKLEHLDLWLVQRAKYWQNQYDTGVISEEEIRSRIAADKQEADLWREGIETNISTVDKAKEIGKQIPEMLFTDLMAAGNFIHAQLDPIGERHQKQIMAGNAVKGLSYLQHEIFNSPVKEGDPRFEELKKQGFPIQTKRNTRVTGDDPETTREIDLSGKQTLATERFIADMESVRYPLDPKKQLEWAAKRLTPILEGAQIYNGDDGVPYTENPLRRIDQNPEVFHTFLKFRDTNNPVFAEQLISLITAPDMSLLADQMRSEGFENATGRVGLSRVLEEALTGDTSLSREAAYTGADPVENAINILSLVAPEAKIISLGKKAKRIDKARKYIGTMAGNTALDGMVGGVQASIENPDGDWRSAAVQEAAISPVLGLIGTGGRIGFNTVSNRHRKSRLARDLEAAVRQRSEEFGSNHIPETVESTTSTPPDIPDTPPISEDGTDNGPPHPHTTPEPTPHLDPDDSPDPPSIEDKPYDFFRTYQHENKTRERRPGEPTGDNAEFDSWANENGKKIYIDGSIPADGLPPTYDPKEKRVTLSTPPGDFGTVTDWDQGEPVARPATAVEYVQQRQLEAEHLDSGWKFAGTAQGRSMNAPQVEPQNESRPFSILESRPVSPHAIGATQAQVDRSLTERGYLRVPGEPFARYHPDKKIYIADTRARNFAMENGEVIPHRSPGMSQLTPEQATVQGLDKIEATRKTNTTPKTSTIDGDSGSGQSSTGDGGDRDIGDDGTGNGDTPGNGEPPGDGSDGGTSGRSSDGDDLTLPRSRPFIEIEEARAQFSPPDSSLPGRDNPATPDETNRFFQEVQNAFSTRTRDLALGLDVRTRSRFGETEQSVRVRPLEDGRMELHIPQKQIDAIHEKHGGDRRKIAQHIERLFHGELIHAIHLQKLANQWRNGGRNESFSDFVSEQAVKEIETLRTELGNLSGDQAQTIADGLKESANLTAQRTGDSAIEKNDLIGIFEELQSRNEVQQAEILSDFIRQTIQLRSTSRLTELSTQKPGVMKAITNRLRDVVSRIRNASRLSTNKELNLSISNTIARADEILREYDDKLRIQKLLPEFERKYSNSDSIESDMANSQRLLDSAGLRVTDPSLTQQPVSSARIAGTSETKYSFPARRMPDEDPALAREIRTDLELVKDSEAWKTSGHSEALSLARLIREIGIENVRGKDIILTTSAYEVCGLCIGDTAFESGLVQLSKKLDLRSLTISSEKGFVAGPYRDTRTLKIVKKAEESQTESESTFEIVIEEKRK